jgi:phthiocerol/phenolphthiocerol synthesis type-I polyketide synthase C
MPGGAGTVFVYSGQGSQWPGMARQLLAEEPAFAAAIAELEPLFVEEVGFSLQRVLAEGEPVRGDARVQPVLMGLQLGLTALWRSYGVQPDAVVGHSMGEVAAAVVAGALTAAEGLRVIALRSRLMSRLAGRGAVALLELDASATARVIADHPGVTLAVYASPGQTVIAGPADQVDAVMAAVGQRDRFAHRVNMEVASHNPIMDAILPELRSGLAGLTPAKPSIGFFSTVSDDPRAVPVFDADYWAANVRNPVRFTQAISAAGADHHTFIEISPHPVMTHAITETLADTHHHSIGTLRRDTDDTLTFHTNLNASHTTHPPQTAHPPEPHPPLPNTPWHHTRHWISATSGAPLSDKAHPLLGFGATDPTTGRRVWEQRLSPDLLWLSDHHIDEVCVLPGAAYAEMALAAATEALGVAGGESWMIRELSLQRVMPVTRDTVVATTLSGDESRACVEIRSRSGDSEWTMHAVATLERSLLSPADGPAQGAGDASVVELDPEELYRRLRSAGQQHGPAFRGIVGLTISSSDVVCAEVRLPSAAKLGSRRFLLHPVMLDVAVQALGSTKAAMDLAEGSAGEQALVLPVRLAGIRTYGNVAEGVCATGSLTAADDPDRLIGRVALTDSRGQALLEIDEVEMLVLRASGSADELNNRLFVLDWEPAGLDRSRVDVDDAMLVLTEPGEADELLGAVTSSLTARTRHCRRVSLSDEHALRTAITRTDTSWDAIAMVFPPRHVDEAQPEQKQLDLAHQRTLLIADVVKALSQRGARNRPRLWIVTRGAHQIDPDDRVTLPQSALRGLARVLAFEHPELKTTMSMSMPRAPGRLPHWCRRCWPAATTTRSPCATGDGMSVDWWAPPPRPPVSRPPGCATRQSKSGDLVRFSCGWNERGSWMACQSMPFSAFDPRPDKSRFGWSPRRSTSPTCSRRWGCIRG